MAAKKKGPTAAERVRAKAREMVKADREAEAAKEKKAADDRIAAKKKAATGKTARKKTTAGKKAGTSGRKGTGKAGKKAAAKAPASAGRAATSPPASGPSGPEVLISSKSAPEVTADDLRGWLEAGSPVTVLDIRSRVEHADWTIPGSILVEAQESIENGDASALDAFDAPKDRPVVVVGSLGRTAPGAVEPLRKRGYEAVSLIGGMRAWSLAWNRADVPFIEGDVKVVQFRRTGKGCLSYLVASEGVAVVIDASLDPEVYLGVLKELGCGLMAVLDTHVHSDHVSRSRLLASRTGAAIGFPESPRLGYPYNMLRDSDGIKVGAVMINVMRTPGHSPESVAYRIDNRALFTGDTLFVIGMGRPDAEPAAKTFTAGARALYRSVGHILTMPGDLIVLPGHTLEPVPFDGLPVCTSVMAQQVGLARRMKSETAFVEYVKEHAGPVGPNHPKITKMNEKGTFPEGDVREVEAGDGRWMVI